MILSEDSKRFPLTQTDVRASFPVLGSIADCATIFCRVQYAQYSLRVRLYQGTPEQTRIRNKFWTIAFHQNKAEDELIRAEFWSRWAEPTAQARARAISYREKAEQDRQSAQVWMLALEHIDVASYQEEAEQDCQSADIDQRTRGAANIGSDGGMNYRILSRLLKQLDKEARRRTTIILALLHRQNRADRALCVIRIYFQRGQLRARASALDGDASPANAPVELSPLSPLRVRPNQSAGESPQQRTEKGDTRIRQAIGVANGNLYRSTSAALDPLTRSQVPPEHARQTLNYARPILRPFSTCALQYRHKKRRPPCSHKAHGRRRKQIAVLTKEKTWSYHRAQKIRVGRFWDLPTLLPDMRPEALTRQMRLAVKPDPLDEKGRSSHVGK